MSVPSTTRTGLTLSGVCSYNGFDFGPEVRTTGFEMLPVEDGSRRTVVYNQYTISVTAPISASSRTALQFLLEDARKRLSKSGGVLIYTGREPGNFSINTNTIRDVNYGPKPGRLGIDLEGNGIAAMLRWSVTVCIPDCVFAKYQLAISEFNYEVTYDVNPSGYTIRNINGLLKIANNRMSPGDRFPRDSADRFRDRIDDIFPWEYGFRRTPGRFTLSKDRSELTFALSDEEIQGAFLPEDCVSASASHELRNNAPLNLLQYSGQIDATYELKKYAFPESATKAFEALVKDRLEHHRKELKGLSKAVIPLNYRISEPEIYGARKLSFSFSYQFTIGAVKDILPVSGLWRPVPNSDWIKWAQSVKGILGVRGAANLTFSTNEDRITDLCDIDQLRTTPTASRDKEREVELKGLPFPVDKPKKDESWLKYETWFEIESDQGNVSYRVLPQADIPPESSPSAPDPMQSTSQQFLGAVPPGTWTQGGAAAQVLLGLLGQSGGGYALPSNPIPQGLQQASNPAAGNAPTLSGPGGVPSGLLIADMPATKPPKVVTQQRVSPMVYIWLVGKALRAGYPIPKPELEDINGIKPIASNRIGAGEGFRWGIYGNSIVPVYWATWRERYLLPEIPDGSFPVPKNPILNPEK